AHEDLDAEHPPIGKDAADQEARRSAAREEFAARDRSAAEARRRLAAAEREKAARKAASDAPDELPAPPEGSYRGVVLEGGNPPPGPRRAPRRQRGGSAHLTWVGFRVEEGIPMVFVQLSQPVVRSLEERDGSLVFTLQSTTIPLRNNRRPLDV